MMDARGLLRDAMELKNAVVDVRKDGGLTALECQQILTGVAQTIKALKDILTGHSEAPAWLNGPLADYMDWPSLRMPCPKCGDTKPAGRSYQPASKDGPERMQHRCYCGYSLNTKPLDRTEEQETEESDAA